jgi:hypothetical protein
LLSIMSKHGILELDDDRLRVAAEHQLILNEIIVRLAEPLANYLRHPAPAAIV